MRKARLYDIVGTLCYPNKWKIVAVGYKPSNATELYFPTKEEAMDAIEKLGTFRKLIRESEG